MVDEIPEIVDGMTMTAAQFEALPEQDVPVELIEGVLVVRGMPSIAHQRAAGMIYSYLLVNYSGNGDALIAPVGVKFDDTRFYSPDVIWIARDNAHCEITKDGVNGPPDLVVEVLSPGTVKEDRGVKFRTYQQYGVREYWLVDPDLALVEVWQLQDDTLAQIGVLEPKETFTSVVLGATIAVKALLPTDE